MAESKKPAPKKSKQGVFDVARPGKGGISASTNSRSVITKHQLMPDPMVNNERRADLPVVLPAKPAAKVKVVPLSQAEATDEPTTAPLVEDVTIDPTTKIADLAPEPDLSGIPESPDEREADSRVARERAAKLQRMIDEEEYFLPIETLEERRSRKVAIFGILLIIILAAAWYNVALDAGLLQNTYNLPHTTFFTVKP